MTGKIDPRKLTPLEFRPRPDPRADWTRDKRRIARAVGGKLSPTDQRRLAAGCRYSPACARHFAAMCATYLCHSKGRWAGQPLVWARWQLADWANPLFGWYSPDGTRAIHRAYIESGKKSGKSTFAAAVSAYMCVFAGEPGAEVYSLASTQDQAAIVQHQVEDCFRASPALEQRARIVHGDEIRWPQTDSGIFCKSGRGYSGANAYCLIMDELHEWQGMAAFEKWTYSSRSRTDWLHLIITNAGDDDQSVCWRQREFFQGVEKGTVSDDCALDCYGKIYSVPRADAEAEVEAVAKGRKSLKVARRANPGLGTVLSVEEMRRDIQRAVHIPAEMANLLRFTYCVWRTGIAVEWLAPFWDKCADDYTLDDLEGYPAHLGLDLASRVDMTALVAVAKCGDIYRQWPIFWIPRSRALELRKFVPIDLWERDGHLRVMPGDQIDQQAVVEAIVDLDGRLHPETITYDPAMSGLVMSTALETISATPYALNQSPLKYHEPTDEYEAGVRAGVILHPGNAVLTWQAKHAHCDKRGRGLKKPVKPDPNGAAWKTVDGIQAAIMAFSQARLAQEAEVYCCELA